MYTKEELFEAMDAVPRVTEVHIRGFKTMYVREVSEEVAEKLYDESSLSERRVKFIVNAICDKDGHRLLTEDDSDRVRGWPLAVKVRLWLDGGRFNGFIQDADEGEEKNQG